MAILGFHIIRFYCDDHVCSAGWDESYMIAVHTKLLLHLNLVYPYVIARYI